MRLAIAFAGTALAVACACSPSPPPAVAPSTEVRSSAAKEGSTGGSGEAAGPQKRTAPEVAAAPARPEYSDPEESAEPVALKPLLGPRDHPVYPKAAVEERECWRSLSLTGEARPDFEVLVAKCGSPTGALEYASPATGKLHHSLDQRDTYVVPVRKGLCYRFFGVGDATIPDLDILIERDGALQGEDKTKGPVAIIDSDKAWCMDLDATLSFHVQIKNDGEGRYVFGVWARPKR